MINEQELLERALVEIKSLRKKNELMTARLEMFDSVMSALHGQPAYSRIGLVAPDIVYDLTKAINQENKSNDDIPNK